MLAIKHTIFRNNFYHFNIRREEGFYRKSLRTDSPKATKKYVSSIKAYLNEGITVSKSELDKFIEMLISNQVNHVVRLGKAATEPLSNTSKSYFNGWYASVEDAQHHNWNITSQYTYDIPVEEIKHPSFNEYLSVEMDKATSVDHVRNAISIYDQEEEEYLIDEDHQFYDDFLYPSQGSEYYSFLSGSIDKHTRNMAQALRENQSTTLRAELEELKSKFAALLPAELNTAPLYFPEESEESNSPYFKDIHKEVCSAIDELTKPSEKTKGAYKSKGMWLVPALGDYRLSEINDEILEGVWNTLRQLPAKNDSKKYGLAQTHKTQEEHIRNIWSFFENNEERIAPKDRISKTTLKEIKQYLVCAIKWGKRRGHINSNPLEDASLPVDGAATPRVPLPIRTVRQITDYCLSNIQEPESWPVLIMIYHGMRNEEICNLTIKDIIIDPDSSVVYMNITDGKTENAVRKVPIHDKILKTGFMEYVDNRKHKLFDTTSARLTLKFTHYRKLLQIPVKTEAGELLNLYSLRHNVITQLQDGAIGKADHVYKLVGHGNKTITLNYTHTNFLLFQRMINQVNYD